MKVRVPSAILMCTMLAALAGCGSAPQQAATSVSAVSAVSAVSVACSPSTVVAGATAQCNAAVQGTGSYNPAVNWQASAGTINASGNFTAAAAAGTVTVTATSMEDTSRSGAAGIVVQAPASPPSAPTQPAPPAISAVSVSCDSSNVEASGSTQCSAVVQGTGGYNPGVTWTASAGSIDANGLFTAPDSDMDVTVMATSAADQTKSGQSQVAVTLLSTRSRHVVMVVEENQSYSTVVRNTSGWPNLNHLIANGALATHFYANTHPSIGNYFMLTTGQILTNNDSSSTIWNVDNLARRMLKAGVSFRIYAEGISQGYTGGNTGLYLARHNPFVHLSDIADNDTVADQVIWPFSQFAADAAEGRLPDFSFIVPNEDDDAHSASAERADAWLETNVVHPLSNVSAFHAGGDGVLIVGFDEAADSDTTHGGGHVATVFWGPTVRAGYQQSSSTVYQQQSLLRTVVGLLNLGTAPGAGAYAPSMSEFFTQR